MQCDFTLEPEAGFPIIKITFPDYKSYSFIVDTGAPGSTIDRSFAKQLGTIVETYNSENPKQVFEYIKPDLKLKPEYPNFGLPLILSDMSSMRSEYPELVGILGLNFLETFKLRINYSSHKIDLITVDKLNGSEFEPKLSVAFNIKKNIDNHYVIYAKVAEKDVEFIIDTGTGNTFIDQPDIIKMIKNRPFLSGFQSGIYSPSKNGIVAVPTKYIRLESIKLPGISWISPVIHTTKTNERKISAGLGNDFFKRYSILLDFSDKKMYLTNDSKYVEDPTEWIGIGVKMEYQNGKLTVTTVMSPSPADKAGIEVGDQILSIDGRNISDISGSVLTQLLHSLKKVDREVILKVSSEKKHEDYTVKLKVKQLL